MSVIVPYGDYVHGLTIQDPDERKRYWDIAVEEMQMERRVRNVDITIENETAQQERKAWIAEESSKKAERLAMGALLLRPEFMSADCLITAR